MKMPLDEQAQMWIKAGPQLKRYRGRIMVVKYGGNAMTDIALQRAFAQDVVTLHALGILVVVVHGGGPQIEILLDRLGKKAEFVQGMRVTDQETLQVVQWVLCGQVQQEIVGLIGQSGGKAVGLSGRDASMIKARPLQLKDEQHEGCFHDLGYVGDVQSVDIDLVKALLQKGFIPVVSPIACDDEGQYYNVNADVVAAELAQALQAEKLWILSNIPGVLDAQGQIIKSLNPDQIERLCQEGVISGGMIPKIAGALEAAKKGVKEVHIVDGRVAHGWLTEILFQESMGTMISLQK